MYKIRGYNFGFCLHHSGSFKPSTSSLQYAKRRYQICIYGSKLPRPKIGENEWESINLGQDLRQRSANGEWKVTNEGQGLDYNDSTRTWGDTNKGQKSSYTDDTTGDAWDVDGSGASSGTDN